MWFSDNIVDMYNTVVDLEYASRIQIWCSIITSVVNLDIIAVILVFTSFSDHLQHSYQVPGAGKQIEIGSIFYYKHVYGTLYYM